MFFNARSACPSLDDPPLESDRRASVRYPCDLETSCQPVASARAMQWSGRILNISQGGICLSIGRRFEAGTLLAIDLPSTDGNSSHSYLGRVVHLRADGCGSYVLGCAFIAPLREDEVQALVG
jgi:hypothetical protein